MALEVGIVGLPGAGKTTLFTALTRTAGGGFGKENVGMATIADERLELVFTCCHPALALDAQVALTLRTLGGLSTEEIARAFLVPEATMAQAARPREAQGQGRRDPVSPAASSSAFRPPRRGARTDDLAGGDVQHRLAGHRRRRSSSPV